MKFMAKEKWGLSVKILGYLTLFFYGNGDGGYIGHNCLWQQVLCSK